MKENKARGKPNNFTLQSLFPWEKGPGKVAALGGEDRGKVI